MIEHRTAVDLWERYRRGEPNLFDPRIYTPQGRADLRGDPAPLPDRRGVPPQRRPLRQRVRAPARRRRQERQRRQADRRLSHLGDRQGLHHAGPCQRPLRRGVGRVPPGSRPAPAGCGAGALREQFSGPRPGAGLPASAGLEGGSGGSRDVRRLRVRARVGPSGHSRPRPTSSRRRASGISARSPAGPGAEVGRRVARREVAPALEGPVRTGRHRDEARVEDQPAARMPSVPGQRLDGRDRLPTGQGSPDHPVDRALPGDLAGGAWAGSG